MENALELRYYRDVIFRETLAMLTKHASRAVMTAVGIFAGADRLAAQTIGFEESSEIARRMTAVMTMVRIDAVTAPMIEGLPSKAVFWIRNNGENGYTYTFREGEYSFWVEDPENRGVEQYLCAVAKEFDYQEIRLEPRFLRDVEIDADIGFQRGPVSLGGNIDGLGLLVRELFAVFRGLGDWVLSKEDTKFLVLVRGHADAGATYSAPLQPSPYNYDVVEYLPPTAEDTTGLNFYIQEAEEHAVGDPFENSDLPYLRSRFIQELVDIFANYCVAPEFGTRVIKGSDVSKPAPDTLRKVDIYLYAY